MTVLECEMLVVIVVLIIIILVANCNKKVYFNSKVDSKGKEIELPEFVVKKIEKVTTTAGKTIAVYTVVNYFFSKKNAKGWVYNEYKFYDRPHMYQVGDVVTFKKI